MIEWPTTGRARQEFEAFVAGSGDELLRTAYLIAWDLAEAEDLAQETLLRVARRWRRVRAMEHPIAYARRILVNLALDGGKRRSRRRDELAGDRPTDTADETSARVLAGVALRSDLLSALAALPPRQRAVLVLRHFVDLRESEVAEALGCSLGTVKSTASRGLTRMRAVDYRPRGGHRVRPRLALGALAGSAAATAATVAVITLGTGAQEAFAGWTRTPSHASRAQIASAEGDCLSRLAGTPSAFPAGSSPVLVDSRGPFTFVIYASDNATATCIDGPQFTSVLGTKGPGAGVTPAGEIRLNSEHLTTRDGHPYSLVQGHVGADVTGTRLVLDDGTKVTASIANGWFAAWWPGNTGVTSAEITTASGTRTEKVLAPPAPGPNAPGGASVEGSAFGSGDGPRSGFMSVSSLTQH